MNAGPDMLIMKRRLVLTMVFAYVFLLSLVHVVVTNAMGNKASEDEQAMRDILTATSTERRATRNVGMLQMRYSSIDRSLTEIDRSLVRLHVQHNTTELKNISWQFEQITKQLAEIHPDKLCEKGQAQ